MKEIVNRSLYELESLMNKQKVHAMKFSATSNIVREASYPYEITKTTWHCMCNSTITLLGPE